MVRHHLGVRVQRPCFTTKSLASVATVETSALSYLQCARPANGMEAAPQIDPAESLSPFVLPSMPAGFLCALRRLATATKFLIV